MSWRISSIGYPEVLSNDWRVLRPCANPCILMIPFPKDFQDFLRLLKNHRVKYVVVGGYALGYHGYVRATGDLDLFVEISESNADRLIAVFQDFGFSQGVKRELFLAKNRIVRMGRPPMRLEILTEISGVGFRECYENRERVQVGDFSVNFINLENLIKNKKSTGRSKDRADVENLSKNLDSGSDPNDS